jgi:hypothetical protein
LIYLRKRKNSTCSWGPFDTSQRPVDSNLPLFNWKQNFCTALPTLSNYIFDFQILHYRYTSFFFIETVISLFKSLSCESLLPMTIELSCITYSGFIQIIKEIITFLLEIKSSLSTRIKHEIELKYLQNRLSFYILK